MYTIHPNYLMFAACGFLTGVYFPVVYYKGYFRGLHYDNVRDLDWLSKKVTVAGWQVHNLEKQEKGSHVISDSLLTADLDDMSAAHHVGWGKNRIDMLAQRRFTDAEMPRVESMIWASGM